MALAFGFGHFFHTVESLFPHSGKNPTIGTPPGGWAVAATKSRKNQENGQNGRHDDTPEAGVQGIGGNRIPHFGIGNFNKKKKGAKWKKLSGETVGPVR